MNFSMGKMTSEQDMSISNKLKWYFSDNIVRNYFDKKLLTLYTSQ